MTRSSIFTGVMVLVAQETVSVCGSLCSGETGWELREEVTYLTSLGAWLRLPPPVPPIFPWTGGVRRIWNDSVEVQVWNVCGFPQNGPSNGDRGGVGCVSGGQDNKALLLFAGLCLGSSIRSAQKASYSTGLPASLRGSSVHGPGGQDSRTGRNRGGVTGARRGSGCGKTPSPHETCRLHGGPQLHHTLRKT